MGRTKGLSLLSKKCSYAIFNRFGGYSLGTWTLQSTPKPVSNCWSRGLGAAFDKIVLQDEFHSSSVRYLNQPTFYLAGAEHIKLQGRFRYSWKLSSQAFLSTKADDMKTESSHSSSSKQGSSQVLRKRSQATLMYLVALVIAMVGCTYAAVPLYRKFCQATGYGGTVRRRETVEEKIARHAQEDSGATRELVVQFNGDVADGMPWKFTPTQREVRLKPGQSTLAFFTAENLSSKPITGVSTYNVSPMKAGIYFNKIQCFCFEEQRLLPGEKIDMPVFFYLDPEFATDPKMDNVNSLILSYTFFKVESSEE